MLVCLLQVNYTARTNQVEIILVIQKTCSGIFIIQIQVKVNYEYKQEEMGN